MKRNDASKALSTASGRYNSKYLKLNMEKLEIVGFVEIVGFRGLNPNLSYGT